MGLSKRLRYEILRRDGHRCRYCGLEASEAELTVDHVVPTTLGGGDEPQNLVACCRDCNAGKSSMPADAPIVEAVADDELRWAEAMKKAAVIARANRRPILAAIKALDKEWMEWGYGAYHDNPFERPIDWKSSVETFIVGGLTKSDLVELVEVAMASKAMGDKKWSYFCGCAWKRLRERQEIARSLIETESAE